jgi:FtsZ-interacting cell division protein YlmF
VAYAIDGQIKRVATETYIITPCNVDVSDGAPEEEPVETVPVEDGDGDFISEFED